jgi:hypothetical protein
VNPQEKSWNMSLIYALSDETSVAKFITTSLFLMVMEDQRIWCLERNKDYSIKSAYKFCNTKLIDPPILELMDHDTCFGKFMYP